MTKALALLFMITTSVAQADPFRRYFEAGVEMYTKNFAKTCTTDLVPGDKPVERLASELLMSPKATADFLKRLRYALDQTEAEGVVITGTRRHRIFAGDLQVVLKVIPKADQPRLDNPNLRFNIDMFREDLIENSIFLKHFGARAFHRASGVYVIASGLDVTPDRIPFVEDISSLRYQLTRDLVELENLHRRHDILNPLNIFSKLVTTECAEPTLPDFIKICLPKAFAQVFKTVPGGIVFAAGAETTVVLKSAAPHGKIWQSKLRERGYNNVLVVHRNGVLKNAEISKPRKRDAANPKTRIAPAALHH